MEVFPVWHVRHRLFADGRPTEHAYEDGTLLLDEQEGDDVKLLGIFSSSELAKRRIERAKSEPGFQDEPDCFMVGTYVLDEDQWTEGFVIMG